MKNKNGFTLVELIVVIVIIGVIVLFALPNVLSSIERQKKDQMITDAKDLLIKTKRKYVTLSTTGTDCISSPYQLGTIDVSEDITKSPFGNNYNRTNSCVIVDSNGTAKVILTDGEYIINAKTIIELNSDNKYEDVQIIP